MTGEDHPAPLVRAFWRQLLEEVPDLDERRSFLRRLAEGAAGPLPRSGALDPGAPGRTTDDRVPVPVGVALAVAVAAQFDGPADEVPAASPSPPPGVPPVTARVALRELVRRARMVGGRVRRRVGARSGRR
jgi:hypothetical protein